MNKSQDKATRTMYEFIVHHESDIFIQLSEQVDTRDPMWELLWADKSTLYAASRILQGAVAD